MKQAQKKFTWYAVAAVFVLLTVLLGIINGINFTMASQDADRITQRIAEGHGAFGNDRGNRPEQNGLFGGMQENWNQGEQPGGFGPMGPTSPEIQASMRYFTAAFDKNGNGTMISYQISAVSQEEALAWAATLTKEGTGWTRGTYRYRVYKDGDRTLVTVIDQGRELLPSYRILLISVIGEAVGLVLSYVLLRLAAKRVFAPLEEADRKQQQFITQAEREFKLPLTVISAGVEVMEREQGPTENTKAIRRQVRKMTALVRKLGTLTVFREDRSGKTRVDLSALWRDALERNRERFERRNLILESQIGDNVTVTGLTDALKQTADELIENALTYAGRRTAFTLTEENGRVRLRAENDTTLPEGSVDQVFDRFTVLENAAPDRTGLGLAYVKETVKAHNGRASARVTDGTFVLELEL